MRYDFYSFLIESLQVVRESNVVVFSVKPQLGIVMVKSLRVFALINELCCCCCCCSERRCVEIEAAFDEEQAFGFCCRWSQVERSSGKGMQYIIILHYIVTS